MFKKKKYFYNWDTDLELRKAVQYILEGNSFHMAQKKTGVCSGTIKRFYNKYARHMKRIETIVKDNNEPTEMPSDTNITVFTNEQEVTLMKCFKEFENLFYGLTQKECRMLAYQMMISEDMKIPVGWKHGMASIAWLNFFRVRYSRFMLTLKKPDRFCTSSKIKRFRKGLERDANWEKNTVATFYDNLEKTIQKIAELKDNKRIYSLDEAYISVNLESRSAADRARDSRCGLFTICCFICADGSNLPPIVVKPYVSSGVCSDIHGGTTLTAARGQMTPDLFTEVMNHFVKHSHSSLSNPSILIIDTDLCHLSYAAVALAQESGVHILTMHPHVTSLLQPLQGNMLELFYKTYYDALENGLIEQKDNNIGKFDGEDKLIFKPIDIGKCIGEAYSKAMTSENIENGFKKCGISPFDRDLFTDSDYLSCLDQSEKTCIECKIRDDRSRRLDLDKSLDSDVTKQDQVSSCEQQVEESKNPDDDEGELSQTQGNKVGEPKEHIDILTNMQPRTQAGQELDKLKRRLIRSVARLIKEKKTEEEVWDEMRKECGDNCKKLWMRMRSLTLKKLKRLIDAGDRNEFVPAIARMTLTDWLLYDLVIVHEKVDVISRSNKEDSKVLNNLFSLVQRFQIEGRVGDDLAEAWTAATVSYNSKGHQCSPMLMQRRWYQIKELTRHKLYQFWFNYRGNERLLITAKQDPPTALQRAVALRYPEIITKQFPSWEERIVTKLVIMPEEFEIRMNKMDLMKPIDEAVPDVEIIEKKIDTITVESDSDFDDDQNSEEPAFPNPNFSGVDETLQTPVKVQVKTEPEDPYGDIDITEHPVYPEEKKDRFQDAIEKLAIEEDRISMSHVTVDGVPQEDYVMPLITNVVGASDISTTNTDMEIDLENPADVNVSQNEINTISEINVELESITNNVDDNSQESIVIDDDEDHVVVDHQNVTNNEIAQNRSETDRSNVIDITSPEAKRGKQNNDKMTPTVQNVYCDKTNTQESSSGNVVCPIITETLRDSEELIEEDIIKIAPEKDNLVSGNAAIIETNISDDGFEFADDGIEYDEEHSDQSETPEMRSPTSENADTPKFDLKLLMHPVVYTTKLDDMHACKGRSFFNTIDEKCLVDKIFLESKPVSAKSINVEQIKAENDEKANDITIKEENSEEFDVDLFQNESSNESDSDELETPDNNERVKISSFLLQKPRSRSYNPIQLCKNPDFNTRLKRLPLGFYSSERNRVFLKACKPMTIDLSKAFESKLINGTLYLKPSDSIVETNVEKVDVSESAAAITPSAVAVQSLMDTTDVDKILQDELKKRVLERNKTINLPNISVVRQINQQLLMAEVAPIVTQVDKSTHDVSNTLNNSLPSSTLNKSNNINTETTEIMKEKPTSLVIQTSHVNETPNQTSTRHVTQTPPTPMMNTDKSTNETVTNSLLPMINNDKQKEDKTVEKQRKKYARLNVHRPLWLSKLTRLDMKPNESLLTIDTLYKVLNALDPTSVAYKKPNSKGQNKSLAGKLGRPTGSRNQSINNKDSNNRIPINPDNLIEQSPTNLPSHPPTQITTASTTKKTKANVSSLPKKRNCCWARAKINKLNGQINVRENKHKCPETHCRCCCREVLRQTEINLEIQLLENIQNRDQFDETIEQVVQQSRNSPNVLPLTPISYPAKLVVTESQQVTNANVMSSVAHLHQPSTYKANTQPTQKTAGINIAIQTDVDEDNPVTIINHSIEDIEPQEIIDADNSETEVTIDLVDDEDNVSSPEIQTPKPKIRIRPGIPSVAAGPLKVLNRRKISRSDESNNPTPPPVVPTASTLTAILPSNSTSPSLEPTDPAFPKVLGRGTRLGVKVVAAKSTYTASTSLPEDENVSAIPCSCRPNVVVDKLSAMLVVDGSNECPRHTKSRVSKETRIYLNRRHMSAAARPFYVGKNKILLTNIIPRRTEPKLPPAPQAPLELPASVQIVLLADGTLSYLIEPGAELTHEEKKAMPSLLASILDHIKASGLTLPLDDLSTQECTSTDSTRSVKNNENSYVTSQNNGNSYVTSQNNGKTNANEEVPSTTPIPESKNNSNTDIVQTQKEGNQESSNEVESVPENLTDCNTDIVQTDLQKKASEESSNRVKNNSNETDTNIIQTELHKEASQNQESSNELTNMTENNTDSKKKMVNQESSVDDSWKTSFWKSVDIGDAKVLSDENDREEHSLSNDENDSLIDIENTDMDVTETKEINDLIHGTERKNTNNTSENDKTNNTAENENTNNTLASSSRNLLSDLMEMSGILEEDVNPIQQSINTAPGEIQPLVIDTTQISSTRLDSMSVPPLSPLPEKHAISARFNEKVYNLNPITSFAELKYACDNNGLFFKLDLNSGLIVPINVCIQKTPQSATKNATPSEVIDLTDDQSFTLVESVNTSIAQSTKNTQSNTDIDPKPKLPSSLQKQDKNKTKLHVIKPKDISMMLKSSRRRNSLRNSILLENQIDLDKETPPSQPKVASTIAGSMEGKKVELMKRLSNNLKPLKFDLDKRSPIILRKNALLNYSTPITQRLSNLKKKAEAELFTETEYLESSDDSDDEPLAKIAKKIRPNESAEAVNVEESQEVPQRNDIEDDNVDFEDVIDAMSAIEPPTVLNSQFQDDPMQGPVPTQLVLSGAALKQPASTEMDQTLSFVASESDEDSGDDCILGV